MIFMNQDNIEELELLFKLIKQIKPKKEKMQITALTGSGISKGSGIPTFRGKDGLWRNYNAMELATPQAFKSNPDLVWEWYSWRIGLILEKNPNPAHYALVKLQEEGLLKYVITQNVDSLHMKAGTRNIIEVHGNIFRTKCTNCNNKALLEKPPEKPPFCECGTMLRPDVIWFGETLDNQKILDSQKLLTNETDILLIIGTSGLVYPVAEFPKIAKRSGVLVIEFNLEPTPISLYADYTWLGKAEETLVQFVEKLLST